MSGHGILRAASAFKNRLMGGIRRFISPSLDNQLQTSMPSSVEVLSYQLDDLMLEGVKRSLPPMDAIFFEPLSGRFASIRVKRRRLSLRASMPGHHCFELIIKDKKGKQLSKLKARDEDIGPLFMAMVSRTNKFHTITIRADTSVLKDLASAELLMKSLLAAAMENELTDVRRFELMISTSFALSVESVAAFIDQVSPSLRHLLVKSWAYADQDTEHHLAMVTALDRCDQLRSVDLIQIDLVEQKARMELMEAICSRPRLNALRIFEIDDVPPQQQTLAKHSFTFDFYFLVFWMRAHAELPGLKQFLARIETVHFSHEEADHFPLISPNDFSAIHLDTIISALRSPAKVFVRMAFPITEPSMDLMWMPVTLNNWLQWAGRYRAVIKIVGRQSQVALPTVQQLAAIKEKIEQANIYGLMPLPAHDAHHLTFSFANGAKVELLLE